MILLAAGAGLATGLAIAPTSRAVAGAHASCPEAPPEVHFSPHGGCTSTVVALLDAARETVRIQAYGFTSAYLDHWTEHRGHSENGD